MIRGNESGSPAGAPILRRGPSAGSSDPRIGKRIRQVLFTLVFFGAILALVSGDPGWPMMWLYLVSFVAALCITGAILARVNPEVIAERAELKSGAESWDRWLAPVITAVCHPATLVVSALDHRYGWTPPYPLAWQILALLVGLAAYGFIGWAMAANRHFEGLVRIQDERGHAVATGGPYGFVRHPGYVGMMFSFAATPLLLGSLWGLVPAGVSALLLIVRTALEDRTLRRKLAGYEEYAKRVRFRLVPGVW